MSGLSQIQSKANDIRSPHKTSVEDQVWLVDWQRYSLPYCSIYVVAPDGHWPCKIGISTYARKRLNALQTSHWKRLEAARCFWVPTVGEARRIEKKSHQILKEDGSYLLGEWFDRTPDKAGEVVEFAAALEGIEINKTIHQEEILEDLWTQWNAMVGAIWARDSEAISAEANGYHTEIINPATGKPVKANSRY